MSQRDETDLPLDFIVPQDVDGERLDKWLAAQFPDCSRSQVQQWIKSGLVTVNHGPARASTSLAPFDCVHVSLSDIPPKPSAVPIPEPIDLDVIFENRDIAVINKPAGMVVHPAPGHDSGTMVNAIMYRWPEIVGIGSSGRPGIVHRLDKDTSGLIVVAKHEAALVVLQHQFKSRTVFKEYLALLEGRIEPAAGRIDAPIGRHASDRKRHAVYLNTPEMAGSRVRTAVTEYETLALYSVPARGSTAIAHFSYVAAHPLTGRTHQIRVHFAWKNHPIAGDVLYGFRRQRLPLERMFLHAHRLRFVLPDFSHEQKKGRQTEFVAPLASDLQAVLDGLAEDSV